MKKPKFNSSMFDAIRSSLGKEKSGGGLRDQIMKFESGKTYLVRLVPYLTDPSKSIFHYYNHIWQSTSTGSFVSTLCPSTFDQKCPIDAFYLSTYRNGSEAQKLAAKPLSRKENWLVNAYIIDDPVNPDNNGQVKLIRYGRELAKIIESALQGDDAEEIGASAFDVAQGCTLRIKCEARTEKRGGVGSSFVTYASSKFLKQSDLDLTEEEIDEIHDKAQDLTKVYSVPTYAELQKMLDEHFFNQAPAKADEPEDDEDDDASDEEVPAAKPATSFTKKSREPSLENDDDETDPETQAKLKKLLADL